MKNRLFVLLLLISNVAFSQTGIFTKPNNSYGTIFNRVRVDSALLVPVLDTTFTPQRIGTLVIRPQDSSLYVAQSIIVRPYWVKVGTGAGGGGYTVGWGLAANLKVDSALVASLWFAKHYADSLKAIVQNIYTQWPAYRVNDSTIGIKKAIPSTQSGYLDSLDFQAMMNKGDAFLGHNQNFTGIDTFSNTQFYLPNLPYNSDVQKTKIQIIDTTTGRVYHQSAVYIDQTGAQQNSTVKWDNTNNKYVTDTVNKTVEWYQQFKRGNIKADTVLQGTLNIAVSLNTNGWTRMTDWAASTTETIVGDGNQIANTHAFSGTNWAYSPFKIGAHDATVEVEYRITSIGTSAYAGIVDVGTSRYFPRWAWAAQNLNDGKCYTATDATGFSANLRGQGTVPAVGDIIRIFFRRNFAQYTITVYNLTKGTMFSGTEDDAMIGENINDYNPGLMLLNCTAVVRDFRIWTNNYRPDLLWVCASIAQNTNSAQIFDSSYVGRIQWKSNLTNAIDGGSGDGLLDVRDRIVSILKQKPRAVVIADMGYNDINNGRTYASWQADYQWLVDTLHREGIYVILQRQTAANPPTIPDSINNFVIRTFQNNSMTYQMVFDSTTSTFRSANYADNLGHLNAISSEFLSNQFVKHIQDFSGRASNSYIASGNYTPTLNNRTNVTGSTAYLCQWMRVGNVVTVSGRVDINATANAQTFLDISLPTTTNNFSASNQAGGSIERMGGTDGGSVYALSSSANVTCDLIPSASGSRTYAFSFMYTIQ